MNSTNELREDIELMELRILEQIWRLEDAIHTLHRSIQQLHLRETEGPIMTDLRMNQQK